MDDEQLRAMHEKRLKEFKRRADDIRSCALYASTKVFVWGTRFHVQFSSDSTAKVGRELPKKSEVSYALSLIRPLTLNTENIYHQKVMGSLKYFADENLYERIAETKQQWRNYPPRRMQMFIGKVGEPEYEATAWDNELADSYLYGGLVHADSDKGDLLDKFDSDEVIFAASAAMSSGFSLVHNTTWLLHHARPDMQDEPVLDNGTQLPGGGVIAN